MGRIVLTIEGSSVGTISYAADVSSADTARLVAHFGRVYGVEPANAEAVNLIVKRWFEKTVSRAAEDAATGERAVAEEAARAAAAGVTEIAVSFAP